MSDDIKTLKPRISMKREIAKAILRIQSEVGILLKTEKNLFQHFDYVGIDTFFEHVAPIAAKHGVFWTVRLENSRRERGKETEKNNDIMHYDVEIDLKFEDGTIYPSYSRFPLMVPFMAAQTAGTALSYASKLFMRHEFKIATSTEADIDQIADNRPSKPDPQRSWGRGDTRPHIRNAHRYPSPSHSEYRDELPHYDGEPPSLYDDEPVVVPAHPKVAPYESPTERIERLVNDQISKRDDIEAEMCRFASRAMSLDELQNYWKSQMSAMRNLRDSDPSKLERIRKAFADRKVAVLKATPKPTPSKVHLATRPMEFPKQSLPPVAVQGRRILRSQSSERND